MLWFAACMLGWIALSPGRIHDPAIPPGPMTMPTEAALRRTQGTAGCATLYPLLQWWLPSTRKRQRPRLSQYYWNFWRSLLA
jgi:hypothetical protein